MMSGLNYYLFLIVSIIMVLPGCGNHYEKKYTSPDGSISFEIEYEKEPLSFSVTSDGQSVVERSPLEISIDEKLLTENVKLVGLEMETFEETYERMGSHLNAVNHYNNFKLELETEDMGAFFLEVRIFDNAAAFRFILPGEEGSERIPDETTSFTIPKGSMVWYHDLHMHYESVHDKAVVSEVPVEAWMAPPVTYQLPNEAGYAAVTEANLKNYSGMAFQMEEQNKIKMRLAHHQPTSYPYELRYSEEDVKRLAQPASIEGTITTPWRVLIIGKDLNSIVNNDVVHHLNPSPDNNLFPEGFRTSWIKPGRAVWKYLDGGGDGSLETMKKFTDQAAELGFEHNILEGFWRNWTDNEIKELVAYGNERGVGTWLWKHSNTLQNEADRLAFFDHARELGIAGVKLDFFDHEAKEVIDLYQDILRETAERKLLVNFHGANKPTGESRTWPNELTREAIRGMEASKLEDRATHNTTVPFTRFLAGHAEYTPLHFGERRKNTTWAHQVASGAIMNSPLLTYAANPENILENPAVDLIKKIPSIWDETIVLPPSEIGELAVFARRSGNEWFLAIMNGTEAKKLEIPLTFLSRQNLKGLIAKDDPENDAAVIMEEGNFGPNDTLIINLNAGGGFVARFSE
ncbi:glycoside hydrolase family 97 catalytic domain-containing protein [Cyclobacterium plantarum]|uniref:glycoside hydrolase family 97 protein n=1 Tax=Cyclobacterium plantarum TaxID=2716263 RepID=UPI003F6E740E